MRVANKACFIVRVKEYKSFVDLWKNKTWITCHFDGLLLKKGYLNDK
jgi:hypothetical protein